MHPITGVATHFATMEVIGRIGADEADASDIISSYLMNVFAVSILRAHHIRQVVVHVFNYRRRGQTPRDVSWTKTYMCTNLENSRV